MNLTTFIWTCFLVSVISFGKVSAVKAKTLVLQIEVSHSRNRDQTTLIFREKTVDFVTNSFQMSSNQAISLPRLGRFTAPLNKELKLLKRKIASYRKLIVSKNKKKSLSKGLRNMASAKNPHAPVIRLGGDGSELEIEEGHTYFRPLRAILYQAEEQRWTCVSCAEYKKEGQTIVRVIKNRNRKPISQTFSLQNLQCFPVSQKRIECVDIQFGIFEI